MSNAPIKFVGWLRIDAKRWSPVCESQSRERCWEKLEARPDCRGEETVVLVEGEEPNPGSTCYS